MPKQQSKLQEQINFYLTVVVLFLFVVIPPILCGLLYLSRVPDVTWDRNDGLTYDRIWMYRERRPVGIGYQNHRVVAKYSATEVCVKNRLRFFLWGAARRAEPSTTSQKMVFIDNRWQPTGEPCQQQ